MFPLPMDGIWLDPDPDRKDPVIDRLESKKTEKVLSSTGFYVGVIGTANAAIYQKANSFRGNLIVL